MAAMPQPDGFTGETVKDDADERREAHWKIVLAEEGTATSDQLEECASRIPQSETLEVLWQLIEQVRDEGLVMFWSDIPHVSGALVRYKGVDHLLVVKWGNSRHEHITTVAHELGHYRLDHLADKNDEPHPSLMTVRQEGEANGYAIRLIESVTPRSPTIVEETNED